MFKIKKRKTFKKILRYGIYTLIFLLPLQTRLILKAEELGGNSWEYGTISLYGIDIVLAILVLFGLEYFVEFVFEKFKIKKNYWILGLILFFAWVVFSSLYGRASLFSAYWIVRFFLMIFFAFVVSVVKPKLKNVAVVFLSAGVIQSLLAIWQFVSQQVAGSKWLGMSSQMVWDPGVSVVEIADERWLRVYGSFSHPNILAGFLVVAIIFCIYLASNYKSPIKIKGKHINPSIFNFFIPVLFIGLTLTFCRSAFIALVCSSVILGIVIFIKNKKELHDFKKVAIVLLTCFLIFGIIFSSFVKQRTTLSSRLENESMNQRQSQYEVSTELIRQNPVVGHGIGNFTKDWYELDSGLKSWNYQPVHNLLILIFVELGIVGLVLFLATIALKIFQKQRQRQIKISRVQIFKFIFLVVILILSLFDHYLWSYNSGLILLFLAIGLV